MEHLWLRLPFALNILILFPVCVALFSANAAAVFQGAATASRGLELLIASLWFGVLAGSLAGLALPQLMAPLLAFQVLYKATWLAVYVVPAMARGEPFPVGVAACFAFIVVAWPLFLWLAYR